MCRRAPLRGPVLVEAVAIGEVSPGWAARCSGVWVGECRARGRVGSEAGLRRRPRRSYLTHRDVTPRVPGRSYSGSARFRRARRRMHHRGCTIATFSEQGPERSDSCGPTPDEVHAGPADHREGDEGDRSRPGPGTNIRPQIGHRCTPQHKVLCGTYLQARRCYSTWRWGQLRWAKPTPWTRQG